MRSGSLGGCQSSRPETETEVNIIINSVNNSGQCLMFVFVPFNNNSFIVPLHEASQAETS